MEKGSFYFHHSDSGFVVYTGVWFGFGYCPFTDWQWQVKEKLGERNLPPNFVEYFAEKIAGRDFSPELVSNVIAYSFAAAAIISVYVNFILPRLGRKKRAI